MEDIQQTLMPMASYGPMAYESLSAHTPRTVRAFSHATSLLGQPFLLRLDSEVKEIT